MASDVAAADGSATHASIPIEESPCGQFVGTSVGVEGPLGSPGTLFVGNEAFANGSATLASIPVHTVESSVGVEGPCGSPGTHHGGTVNVAFNEMSLNGSATLASIPVHFKADSQAGMDNDPDRAARSS